MQNSPKLKNKFKSKLFDILSKKSGTPESQERETAWNCKSSTLIHTAYYNPLGSAQYCSSGGSVEVIGLQIITN